MKFVKIIAAIVTTGVSACVPDEPTSFATPSGLAAHTVRCTGDTGQCMQKASAACSGSYQVLESHSNAGGLVADILPGPVTWYTLTYSCGKTDGQMPSFPFRGEHMPAMAMPVYRPQVYQQPLQTYRTETTNCTSVYSSLNCTTTSY